MLRRGACGCCPASAVCSEACTTQEVVAVEPLTFSVLFSSMYCCALAPRCPGNTQEVVAVEPPLFSVLFSSRRPQLVIVIVQPVVFSLVCLTALLPALRGRRLVTYFAWRAGEAPFASRADSFRRRCFALYWPCSSKLRRALSAFERPLLFTPSSWLLFLGMVVLCASCSAGALGSGAVEKRAAGGGSEETLRFSG